MAKFTTLMAATLAAGAVFAAATPASAAATIFAQYSAIGSGGNVYWKNDGTGGSAGQNAISGSGGSLYTIASSTSTVAGSRNVLFSFLQPGLASAVTDVVASFTLNASVRNSPAVLAGGMQVESGLSGSFSFFSTAPITVNSITYSAGSNLLSGSFSQGAISGQRLANSGSFAPSSTGVSIIYTSDFIDFAGTDAHDFTMSLSSITGALQAISTLGAADRALRTFRASSGGSFSADLSQTEVPEPATWALMIVGFGTVGMQLRRRARQLIVA